MTKIIARRIEKHIKDNAILSPEQTGFRKSYSTLDHIQALTALVEKSYEYNVRVYSVFIDFKKAFDSIALAALWNAMTHFKFDENLIKLIHPLYAKGSASIEIDGHMAELDIQRGVRQGDSLSPLLFVLLLQHVLKKVPWRGRGLNINGELLKYFAYADDVVLFAISSEELTGMIEDLNMNLREAGPQINYAKTKWLR
ncbi:hypothetical protein OESDEN_22534, partial [Oesophagostomum dentatum]